MGDTWTKEQVQQHVQAAVAVELYTLPFYITALASIKDQNDPAVGAVHGVMLEEMVHLELAANLSIALDTVPNFTAPVYGVPLPLLQPSDPVTHDQGAIDAKLGALDAATLNMMLDIETPHDIEDAGPPSHSPDPPYDSIGELYGALFFGIHAVGEGEFTWTTEGQQTQSWDLQIKQTIENIDDARFAITLIAEQGEGKPMSPAPQPPYTPDQFPVEPQYRLTDSGDPDSEISHFGRFLKIVDNLPDIYSGQENPGHSTNQTLQGSFGQFLHNLNAGWAPGQQVDWSPMWGLLSDAQACWQAGVIPAWTAPS